MTELHWSERWRASLERNETPQDTVREEFAGTAAQTVDWLERRARELRKLIPPAPPAEADVSDLVERLRAAIDAGDWGPICEDDGTWTSHPSKPFVEAHRQMLNEFERYTIPAGERDAEYVAGYHDALEKVLALLGQAYETVDE